MRLIDADKLLAHLNDCALSASPGSGSLKDRMIAKAEYDAIQNCMKAVEEQPTAYDVENMISEVEVKMKAMWYFLDCHSAQCDNESGGAVSYTHLLQTRHYKIERSEVQEDIDYLEAEERRFWQPVSYTHLHNS